MAEHANFETDQLIWGVERPALVLTKWHGRIRQMRQAYYESLGYSSAAVSTFVGRTSGRDWANPNRLVGKTSHKGQRWALHRIVTAYDNHSSELVGWADFANNASSNRSGLLSPAQPLERAAKLHLPTKRFLQGRYGCIREIIGGDDRQGFGLVAASLAIRECARSDQALSAYPWIAELGLKNVLSQMGLRPNPDRTVELVNVTDDLTVMQEPWVLRRVSDVTPALAAVPGAIEALDSVEIVHIHGA